MTTTLIGRWLTRILLYVMVALPVTFLYGYYHAGRGGLPAVPFHFIDIMLILGLMLDPF